MLVASSVVCGMVWTLATAVAHSSPQPLSLVSENVTGAMPTGLITAAPPEFDPGAGPIPVHIRDGDFLVEGGDEDQDFSVDGGESPGRQWIVVLATNAGSPAEALALAVLCAMPGWKALAVADAGTASDWHYEGCELLTVADQARLGYAILAHLPAAGLTRKNVGYLYAVQHGATVVLDADSRHRPRGGHIHRLTVSGRRQMLTWEKPRGAEAAVGNAFAHFGQPRLEPGRSPRSGVVARPVLVTRPVLAPPSILHALCDGRPDLAGGTRAHHPVAFCANVPPVRLGRGVFGPSGALTTLYSTDAFWALLLPSVAPIGADVVRGYWAQRLQWDTDGGGEAFQGPTSECSVTAPADSLTPPDTPDRIASLTLLLARWQGGSPELSRRMVELTEVLAEAEFVGRSDVALARAWAVDLASLLPAFAFVVVRNGTLPDAPPASPLPIQAVKRIEMCALRERWSGVLHPAYHGILVSVHFNHVHYNVIPRYLDLYAPAFPNIVFIGPAAPVHVPYDIHFYPDAEFAAYDSGHYWGGRQHAAIVQVVTAPAFAGFDGYLHTNDDVFLDYWRMLRLNQSRPWFPMWPRCDPPGNCRSLDVRTPSEADMREWGHWKFSLRGMRAAADVLPCWAFVLSRQHATVMDPSIATFAAAPCTMTPQERALEPLHMFRSGSDVAYVPGVGQAHDRLVELLRLFDANGIFSEIAIPSAFVLSAPANEIESLHAGYVWNPNNTVLPYLYADRWLETLHTGLTKLHVAQNVQRLLAFLERDAALWKARDPTNKVNNVF